MWKLWGQRRVDGVGRLEFASAPAWMVALLCAVSFVTDVSGVCVTWVAVTPLCLGDLLPIAAREEAMDEYIEEEDDREDIIVEIGSLLATPRGARDVV